MSEPMIDIGAIALRFALLVAIYASVISSLGGWRQRAAWVRSAERAVYAVFGLVSIAMVVMLYALVTHDFSVQYVSRVSNRAMPMFYTIASLWGGQEGSLLLWLWLLTLYSALAVRQNRYRNREFIPYVIPTLMVTSLLFISMLVFSGFRVVNSWSARNTRTVATNASWVGRTRRARRSYCNVNLPTSARSPGRITTSCSIW